MTNQTTWTDNAGAINNANVTTPLPVAVYTGGTGTTASQVQGNVASGASDAGTNPIKIGGVYTSSPTAFTVGQRVDAWFGTVGSLGTFITNLAGVQASVAAQTIDALPANSNALGVSSFNNIFNGTTWDRVRGNIDTAALLTYAAAAAAV